MCLDALRQTFSEISLVTLRWDYTTMYERRRRIQTLESTKKFSKLQVRIELTTLRVLGSEFKRKFTRILGLHLGLAQNSAVFYIYLNHHRVCSLLCTFRWQSVLHFFQILQLSMQFFFFISSITQHVLFCVFLKSINFASSVLCYFVTILVMICVLLESYT